MTLYKRVYTLLSASRREGNQLRKQFGVLYGKYTIVSKTNDKNLVYKESRSNLHNRLFTLFEKKCTANFQYRKQTKTSPYTEFYKEHCINIYLYMFFLIKKKNWRISKILATLSSTLSGTTECLKDKKWEQIGATIMPGTIGSIMDAPVATT
jgi:hypothetical protein